MSAIDDHLDDPFTSASKPPSPPPEDKFTIILGEYTWFGPTAALVEKSQFFRAVAEGGFKESTNKSVVLHDDDALSIARMLIWAEHDTYPLHASAITMSGAPGKLWSLIGSKERNATPPVVHAEDELDVHVDVWAVADKYGVEQLKGCSFEKMREVLHARLSYKDLIWHLVERLETMEVDTDGLDAFVRNWLLFRLSRYQDDKRLETYVKNNPAFGWDVVKRMRRVENSFPTAYRVEVEDECARDGERSGKIAAADFGRQNP